MFGVFFFSFFFPVSVLFLIFHVLDIFVFCVFDESFSSLFGFSFLGWCFGPSFSAWRLAPSHSWVSVGWPFSEHVVGPSFSSLGLALPVGLALPSLGVGVARS